MSSIDLMGELVGKCEHRIGLWRDHQLVGFAAVGPGASPDKVDNDHLWVGYLVIHPEARGSKARFEAIYRSVSILLLTAAY